MHKLFELLTVFLVAGLVASSNPAEEDINTDHSEECIICYEAFQARSGWLLECGHKYHKSCLITLFKLRGEMGKSCPMCRRDIRLANGQELHQALEENLALTRSRIQAAWGLLGSSDQAVYWGAPVV